VTKFCKDCRCCRPAHSGFGTNYDLRYAKCAHPAAHYEDVDLVVGTRVEHQMHCRVMRNHGHLCGEAGQHFVKADPPPDPPPADDFFSWLARFFRFGL
jgi:hypothetical protein